MSPLLPHLPHVTSPPSPSPCHLSSLTFPMSPLLPHLPHVTSPPSPSPCHLSSLTFPMSPLLPHLPHVTSPPSPSPCHLSSLTFPMSPLLPHLPHVTSPPSPSPCHLSSLTFPMSPLLPHLPHVTSPPSPSPCHLSLTSYPAATVVWVDSPRALILDLGNSVFGFCPLGLIYDERKDAIGKEYKIGSRHPCRLVQFNRLDGFGIVSLQPSVLERPYMKFADLKVGEVVEGKVERHGDYGMTVSLTDTIRGMVPRLHLADVDLKNPKARFKEGGAVKCRVLSLEPEKRRLLLTCKRSLVQSAKEHLCNYSRAKPGEVYLGVIAAVRDIGCVVRFFGDVVGRVHKLELSSIQLVSDPKAMFSVGQTVECRVVECNPASKELKLSFRLDGDKLLASTGGLDVSMVMDLEVMGIASGGINLRAPSGELAFLPTPHLSDYLPLCPSLLKLHQAGLEKATREGSTAPCHAKRKTCILCSLPFFVCCHFAHQSSTPSLHTHTYTHRLRWTCESLSVHTLTLRHTNAISCHTFCSTTSHMPTQCHTPFHYHTPHTYHHGITHHPPLSYKAHSTH